uniref:Coiled-coil domain-containing protein SCD2-like isoform X2 n=1 Tax=Tanacetum cinerariifolium TaxID=118510 RepID=A0A699IR18_TANCI|nr:coiled-coil domain-containing protein SCD2-like isoform X2 [Tanacetum cinerariifolium]
MRADRRIHLSKDGREKDRVIDALNATKTAKKTLLLSFKISSLICFQNLCFQLLDLRENVKDETLGAMKQLKESESEAKALRTMTQRMILTHEDMVGLTFPNVSWSSPHWADGSLSEHDRVMLCREAAIERRTYEVETYATSGNLDYLDSIPKGIHETMRSNQEHDFGLQKKETLNIRHSQSHEGRGSTITLRCCRGENGLSIADATMLPIKSATYDLNLMKSEAISNLPIATKDDDIEEVATLNDEAEASEAEYEKLKAKLDAEATSKIRKEEDEEAKRYLE